MFVFSRRAARRLMGWSERWQYRAMYLTESAPTRVAAGLGIDETLFHAPLRRSDLIREPRHAWAIEEGGIAASELLIGSFGTLFRGMAAAAHSTAARRRSGRAREGAHGDDTPLIFIWKISLRVGLTTQLIVCSNARRLTSQHLTNQTERVLPAPAAGGAGRGGHGGRF